MTAFPDFLTHYYEATCGPFRSLTHLPVEEADAIQASLRAEGKRFASQRQPNYLELRREIESRIRALFIEKGGQPQRTSPHYMILGECAWLKTWYITGRELRLPLAGFPTAAVSFTYGDSFPAMRFLDGKPYRGQVYTLSELPGIIAQYGLPQAWNADGKLGPERYIEAQIWEDSTLLPYLSSSNLGK